MVEWNDRTTIAQLSFPNMMLPIQYALTWPDRPAGLCEPLDFARIPQMTFKELAPGQFPALELARQAGIAGQTMPTVLSAADEIAVAAFLEGRIRFVDIASVVESTLAAHDPVNVIDLDVIAHADHWARDYSRAVIERRVHA